MKLFRCGLISFGISVLFLISAMVLASEPFGELPDGSKVEVYTLTNKNGMQMRVMNYGATVLSITAPDHDGKMADVVLGCDTLDGYVAGVPYFGAVVGRYGNRIANGKFTVEGKECTLPLNDKNGGIECSLHGGLKGFDKVIWDAFQKTGDNSDTLVLHYRSKDGEEGYPGNLNVYVVYTLTDHNEWVIHYRATTDSPTVLNLTQHTYFNLTGAKRDILDHQMMLNCGHYTPTNAGLIPTGEIATVEGTPMDFRTPTAIGQRINEDFEALKLGGGYDHNWVLSRTTDSELELAARVKEPESGRVLEAWTTQPGVQFYAGNFLDGTLTGKNGVKYEKRFGFCLETQHYPDSPNQPNFPTTELKPGETYTQTTVFKFLAE
ncbi:MAG: galactose mutarotase [Thermoguttaceae bacterium]|nr:galactose mutarotase [Thermoguttaceae bacterium]